MACRWRASSTLALVVAAWGASACAPAPAPPRGPIVLVTVGGLRADVTGPASRGPGWTRELDAWTARQDAVWTGTAVAASSEPLVSLASLLCGAAPWQHQVLGSEARIRRRLPTLAEVLGWAGYTSRAYVPSFFHRPLAAGFDQVSEPLSERESVDVLAGLDGAELAWLHLPDAELARGRWRHGAGGELQRHRLLAYADPGTVLSETDRRQLWSAYGREVRELDRRLGVMLEALGRSPAWERTTLVLTASHGLELGEHGQILYGENLGRETIEVPLLLRLPREIGTLAEPPGRRVAQTRLWTTIAELAGIEPAPVHPPSLFRVSDEPALSELYAGNGVNLFSLLADDPRGRGALQLFWTTRFAPAEPEYYLARRARAGASARELREPPGRIFARLGESFRRTPPLTGPPGAVPDLRLERWTAAGVEPVEDPAAARELALRLRRRWTRFVDRERPPEEERTLSVEPHPEPSDKSDESDPPRLSEG